MKKIIPTFLILFALLLPSNLLAVVQTNSTDLERGSSQYWSITDASQTGLDFATDLTIEAWVKFESLPTSGNAMAIVSKMTGGTFSTRSYYFEFDNVFHSGANRLLMATVESSTLRTIAFVAFTPSTSVWIHFATTHDASGDSGNGTTLFYIDGVEQTTTYQTRTGGNIQNGSEPFFIGADDDGGTTGQFFDGLINDVRVWSTVRTQSEIDTNKDNCDLSISETGLVSWWGFNNDGTDENANGNDLTNNNSATFDTDVPYTCAAAEDYNNSQIW